MNCVRCGTELAVLADEKLRSCATCLPTVRSQVAEFDAIAADHHKRQKAWHGIYTALRPLKSEMVRLYDDLDHMEAHPHEIRRLRNLFNEATATPVPEGEPMTIYGFKVEPFDGVATGRVIFMLKDGSAHVVELGDTDSCQRCMGTKKVRWNTGMSTTLPWIEHHMRQIPTEHEGPCPGCVS